jgi:hypothetical protein
MGLFRCDLVQYHSRSAVETLIKKAHDDKATELLLMKYFKALDNPAVDTFIEHLTCLICEAAFLNHSCLSHTMMAPKGSILLLQTVIEVLFLI